MSSRTPSWMMCLLSGLLACASPPADRDVTPAAEITDEVVTVAELDAWIKEDLFAQSSGSGDPSKLYKLRRDALDRLVEERLLAVEAETLGLASDQLLDQEIAKRAQLGEDEARTFYEANKARFGSADFESLEPRITRHLEAQARTRARNEYLQELRQAAAVAVLLEPPRIPVDTSGPALGPSDAPITIVEFSDYQCPFCKRAEPVVQQVLERYPQQVRFVYRHFPLDSIHPLARGAAEAAACADEQGRFWDYHRRLFGQGAKFDAASLEAYASEAELDLAQFKQCVAEGRTQATVEGDVSAGRSAGVTGTPAFFVNGIQLSGARPLEDFVEVIEEELRRSGS